MVAHLISKTKICSYKLDSRQNYLLASVYSIFRQYLKICQGMGDDTQIGLIYVTLKTHPWLIPSLNNQPFAPCSLLCSKVISHLASKMELDTSQIHLHHRLLDRAPCVCFCNENRIGRLLDSTENCKLQKSQCQELNLILFGLGGGIANIEANMWP